MRIKRYIFFDIWMVEVSQSYNIMQLILAWKIYLKMTVREITHNILGVTWEVIFVGLVVQMTSRRRAGYDYDYDL